MSDQTETWTALFDALRETLRDRAALPKGAASPERDKQHQRNKLRIDEDLAWAQGVNFDPEISDAEFWHIASTKPFYSGKRAGSIRQLVDQAGKHMRDYRALSGPEWEEEGAARQAYEADETAYHNVKDLPRILTGARNITRRQNNLDGRSLVDIFIPKRDRDLSGESMERVYKNLNGELAFGFVTTLHVMTDLGLPVVKTDRVLTRMVIRLGLVTHVAKRSHEEVLPIDLKADMALKLGANEDFSFRIQRKLKDISDATGLSMRAIDWLLVKMGMEPDIDAGFVNTICGDMPQCQICKAQPFCRLGQSKLKRR